MSQKYLLAADTPPINAVQTEYDLIWQVKIFERSTFTELQDAINTWLLTDPVTSGVPRWLGQPVYIATSGNKVSCMFPYAYWVAPTLL
jgi:hypothetical protein